MASHDSNVGDEAEYLRKKNLQDHEYTSISSPEKEDETEVVTSTKTAGPEFHTSKAREDEKELTDAPLKSYKPSVDNLAGSLASEEADKPAKPPPHVSAMNFGFDAISRQSPSYKKYSLLPRYAFDTSEEEDGGDGSEDEGAHLPAEPSPVDTSLPTPSRQPTGPWAIYATNDEDAKVPKGEVGLDPIQR